MCKARLRRYEYPHVVRVVDALPRTPNGKVQRFKLRELVSAGEPWQHAAEQVGEGRRVAVIGAGPSGFYCTRAAARARLRGRPARPPADAVRARARRRGARPPEDQERHADVREDRAARRLPLLRRRRARRRRHARRAARALPRGDLRGRDRRRQPPRRSRARTAPAPTRRRASSPGTTATRTPRRRRSTSRPRAPSSSATATSRIDIARMLVLRPRASSSPTDTADHALEAFADSGVEEVVLLGPPRAGPGGVHEPRAARARGAVSAPSPVVDPRELELDEHSRRWLETEADPTAKRNVRAPPGLRRAPAGDATHRITLRFLRSPVEILGEGERRPGDRRARRAQPHRAGDRPAACAPSPPTARRSSRAGSSSARSATAAAPLPGVPFDDRRGLIRNAGGRVCDEAGEPLRGRVRGRLDQARAERRDRHEQEGRRRHRRPDRRGRRGGAAARRAADADAEATAAWLRGARPASWSGTAGQAIDAHECRPGEPAGRPRVKLVTVDELVAASRAGVGAARR